MRKFNVVTAGSGGELITHSPPCPIDNDVLSKEASLKATEQRFSEFSSDSKLNGMLQTQSPQDIIYTISGNADDLALADAILKSRQLQPKDMPRPTAPAIQNNRASRPSLINR